MYTKRCPRCIEDLTLVCFSVNKRSKTGLQVYCKECESQLKREKKYGISHREYLERVEAQNSRCAICNKHTDELYKNQKKCLCVDHNHQTGEIRGLLCDHCNRGIGFLGDNEETIRSALEYLIKYKENSHR